MGAPWLRKKMFAAEPASLGKDLAEPQGTPTRWDRSAAQKREQVRDITWLTHEPLNFLLRRGDHFDNEPEQYRKMLDPDNIRRMAAAGVKWGLIFFDKGFGLEYEKAHIEQTRQAADLMHQLGMRVNLYVGGTMFTEMFYRELPEAQNWEQRNQWGQWISYGLQTYRHYACPNEPAWCDYLRRVLKIGVVDLRADEISFDNNMLMAEPESCRCPRCLKAFTEFLRTRYPTREAMLRRFGLPDADWVRANEWQDKDMPLALTVLEDPVLQERVRFRCETLANYCSDLYASVKRLNPKTAAGFNLKGVYSFNRYWTNAVYHPLYSGRVDAMSFDTGGYDAGIDPATGALVSQIRSYKVARHLGTSCDESFRKRPAGRRTHGFRLSESRRYTDSLGRRCAQRLHAHVGVFPRKQYPVLHRHGYGGRRGGAAQLAVDGLQHRPHVRSGHAHGTGADSVQGSVRSLFEEQLEGISRYMAMILAGQECVSNAQAALLLAYVRNGGTLVVAGNTGEFNEWHERRIANPRCPRDAKAREPLLQFPRFGASICTGLRGCRGSSIPNQAHPHKGARSRWRRRSGCCPRITRRFFKPSSPPYPTASPSQLRRR